MISLHITTILFFYFFSSVSQANPATNMSPNTLDVSTYFTIAAPYIRRLQSTEFLSAFPTTNRTTNSTNSTYTPTLSTMGSSSSAPTASLTISPSAMLSSAPSTLPTIAPSIKPTITPSVTSTQRATLRSNAPILFLTKAPVTITGAAPSPSAAGRTSTVNSPSLFPSLSPSYSPSHSQAPASPNFISSIGSFNSPEFICIVLVLVALPTFFLYFCLAKRIPAREAKPPYEDYPNHGDIYKYKCVEIGSSKDSTINSIISKSSRMSAYESPSIFNSSFSTPMMNSPMSPHSDQRDESIVHSDPTCYRKSRNLTI